jgi:hypothetical protein
MAQQRLGRAQEARRCYDEAVKAVQRSKARPTEHLQRFQSEAAALLGIAAPADK